MGTYNRHALIAFRLFDRNAEAKIDADWFEARLARAMETRECVYPGGFYRWAHSESDGLPGLIMDRYGDAISVQLNTAGMDKLREPYSKRWIDWPTSIRWFCVVTRRSENTKASA